jgi:hypothetical protein
MLVYEPIPMASLPAKKYHANLDSVQTYPSGVYAFDERIFS